MRKSALAILLSLFTICICSQEVVYEGRMHEDVLSVRWGGIRQYDEYLSPLLYTGQFVALQNEWWQRFGAVTVDGLQATGDWGHAGKVKLQGARLFNRAYTNMIYALGVQGGWGAHYDFCRLMNVEGLSLFAGPYLDFDFFVKEISQNVNKPYSIDLCIDLKAHAGIRYSFAAKRSSYRLSYTIMTGVLGAQFVPEYGQSYYEVTEGIIGGAVGFSSLHNRLTLRHELTFDMQFPHSAWRLGVEHEYVRHSMNNLSFQREQVSLVVAALFNYTTKIRKMR